MEIKVATRNKLGAVIIGEGFKITLAAYTFDLPAEQFLDQASTQFVPEFEFDSATYLGATDSNLDGKSVMVLGVKTKSNDGLSEEITYSFIDVSHLVDTYVASDTSIAIDGYKIKANVSADVDNMLATRATGLYVDGSGKVDKVRTEVEGNFAAFDSDGGIADSGYSVATNAEVIEMLNGIFGRMNPNLAVSPSNLTITSGNTYNVTVTRLGDGTISVTETTALAGVTYEVNDMTITFTNTSATEGTGVYTVTLAQTDNYASATAVINVTGA